MRIFGKSSVISNKDKSLVDKNISLQEKRNEIVVDDDDEEISNSEVVQDGDI